MNATTHKHYVEFDLDRCRENFWKVYKGESYDLWQPDSGKYYGYADPVPVLDWLQSKRLKSYRQNNHNFYKNFDENFINNPDSLSNLQPRIAFRLISRSTDSRTLRACLVPPKTFHVHSSQLVNIFSKNKFDEAYLLGVLCSIPLDWYARRFVEINFTFNYFNSLPIPRVDNENILKKRLVKISGRLASKDERFSLWASQVGVEFGDLKKDEKEDKICEIDALVSILYGLDELRLFIF